MVFGAPHAFWWLLLAVPLVALFFLKVRPRTRTVSTLLFWHEVIPDSRPRRWWRKLRDPLFLLLQLLILLSLVTALAQPQHAAWNRPPRRIVLVLDNSASMQASVGGVEGAGRTWREAMHAAERLVGRLRPDDAAALVTTAPVAEVPRGFTSHSPALLRSLEQIAVTDAPGRLADAIALGRRLLADEPAGELWVITDGSGKRQWLREVGELEVDETKAEKSTTGASERERPVAFTDQDAANADPIAVRWFVTGESADNVAITQFQMRRQRNDPAGFELLALVQNFGRQPVDTALTINLDQDLLDVIPVQIPPGQSQRIARSYLSSGGGVVQATLEQDDALQCDNQAWAVLAARDPINVLLVSPGSIYLERVLQALPGVQLATTNVLPERLDRNQFVVLHRQAIDRLPPGRSLMIDLRSPNPLADMREPVPSTSALPPDSDSPLLYHVQWDEINLQGVRPVEWRFPATPYVNSLDGDPVLTHLRHSDGEVMVLNLSLENSDLAWRAAFPLLMSNLVSWLVDRPSDDCRTVQAGQTVRCEVPFTSLAGSLSEAHRDSSMVWLSPDGSRHAASRTEQQLILGPWEQAGVWTLVADDRAADREGDHEGGREDSREDSRGGNQRVDSAARRSSVLPEDGAATNNRASHLAAAPVAYQVACNLVSAEESDLRYDPVENDAMLASLSVYPAWFWLTLLVTVLLGAEWWLYQRRYIG